MIANNPIKKIDGNPKIIIVAINAVVLSSLHFGKGFIKI